MREMSEQVSCTIGLFPAVDPSRLLMHRPVATLRIRNLPDAADEALTVQSWLTLVPSPQPYCCNCRPDVLAALGTSMHRPLLPLARVNWPAADTFHWVRVAPAQALC